MREHLSKILRVWRTAAFAGVVVATLVGCSESSDENQSQRETIVTYLESTHSPLLIAESAVESSLDNDPEFYSVFGSYSYRYISNYYDAGREALAEVANGSIVTITYNLYPFSGSDIDDTELPVYSNDAAMKVLLQEAGLNTQEWDFMPLEIEIGNSNTLKGIHESLVGCRVGDEVEIYMTYNMAYGSNIIGLVDKESSMLMECTIDSVEN